MRVREAITKDKIDILMILTSEFVDIKSYYGDYGVHIEMKPRQQFFHSSTSYISVFYKMKFGIHLEFLFLALLIDI